MDEGAQVTVYAGADVCTGAKGELARVGAEVGTVKVRVVCTEAVERGRRLDLAAAGANARLATEDSSSVAYIEAPGEAISFISPILDEAQIRLLTDSSGADAMARTLDLLVARSSDESPRDSVWSGR